MSLSQEIKRKTIELGFDLAGVTDAAPIDARQAEIFAEWLKSGFAGQMDYMRRNLDKRLAPARLLKSARSVIVIGLNYTLPRRRPEPPDTAGLAGRVARYAQYEDYHPFVKERLSGLVDFITSRAGDSFGFKICVDSAPLAERALAVRAGLGFIGKNHMLINPELGCEILLGEIITDLELCPDKPVAKLCSDCTKCLDACPTGALRPDGQFDAAKCINYLTIEHHGPIASELAQKMANRLFGCDECVLACPYQNAARARGNEQFRFYADRAELNLEEVLVLTEESFEARFADSPIKRAGLDGLKRNAAICLANMAAEP
ncbi:MAG: tRNA epoxyqueuosine(34) reductase QueG [Phycisphaerales bacterium]|nr:MAG: tRNA epoxyqueuosine(34) reductase QueG [Phycisphaerales bacterium]